MPAPVKLGARTSAWRIAEIEQWERDHAEYGGY
ncbi:helix-turn-helix transcriptional regulator [Haliea sp.]